MNNKDSVAKPYLKSILNHNEDILKYSGAEVL